MKPVSSTVVLLMNLGSPDSCSVKDVRKYLTEFLMDERVIDKSLFTRTLLVKGIIVPFRSPRSAKAYQSIWDENGSPLIHLSNQLKEKLHEQLQLPVELCMRYGNPTPEYALKEITKKYPNTSRVILFPLYPHYAMSSYETAVEYVKEVYQRGSFSFALSVINPFYSQPDYIHALSESIRPYLYSDYDQVLFSYHGIPERHVRKTDPTKMHCLNNDCCNQLSVAHSHCYRHQVFKTTRLVADELQLPDHKFGLSFQSRLGRDPWLKPYTARRLKELPAEGVKKLVVVCPAFVSDCLETLEEMGEEGKEIFLSAGGKSFTLVPCMNIQPLWIEAMKRILEMRFRKQHSFLNNGLEHVSLH
jgi:ferrochelatase